MTKLVHDSISLASQSNNFVLYVSYPAVYMSVYVTVYVFVCMSGFICELRK